MAKRAWEWTALPPKRPELLQQLPLQSRRVQSSELGPVQAVAGPAAYGGAPKRGLLAKPAPDAGAARTWSILRRLVDEGSHKATRRPPG
jgi:hypothetical protein